MAGNEELRTFLRSRRARRQPEDAGLPAASGHRRVPGLRREELAQLAGVSVDYYVRLEQGRNTSVSADVLDAVARALRLDEAERAHLFDLARPRHRAHRRPSAPTQRVRPGVRMLMDSLDGPALLLGRRTDVLATNRMARALICDFDALPAAQRNYAWWIFLDPVSRALTVDWDDVARDTVASLRLDAGRHPDDPKLGELVGELSVKSPEFREWWAHHDVLQRSHGEKRYRHPDIGEVTVAYEALSLPDPDQTLFVYTAEPGSRSAESLQLLSSWAEHAAGAVSEGGEAAEA